MTLDYLLNSHPNRDAIFGSGSTWQLDLSAESREVIQGQIRPYPIRNASEHLLDSLKSMGYENIDCDGVNYNLDYHMHAPDQNLNVLCTQAAFMLDQQTLRSNVALAKKGIEAVSDENKTAVVD